jgi:hypothetical protein
MTEVQSGAKDMMFCDKTSSLIKLSRLINKRVTSDVEYRQKSKGRDASDVRDFVLNLIQQHGHVSLGHNMKTEHT